MPNRVALAVAYSLAAAISGSAGLAPSPKPQAFFSRPVSNLRMTRFAIACFAVIVAGCAARGPSPQMVAELGKATALVREGCYSCLKEAQAIFERLAAPPRPAPRDSMRCE